MDDLDHLLLQSFQRIVPSLAPADLADRLARRQRSVLVRPPRAWCLAVRASDTRINNGSAIITPYQAVRSGTPSRHHVTLDRALLRSLCQPVELLPFMEWTDVAAKLGVHPESLRPAMRTGRFRVRHFPGLGGKRGKPVPCFLNYESLDPSAGRLREPPDPLWGQMWRYAADRIPDDFGVTLRRSPAYANYRGEPRFRGFRWLCPECEKLVRIIYYPLPPYSIPAYLGYAFPAARSVQAKQRPTSFACHHCHRVKFFGRTDRDAWNQFVAHVSGGLLYGHEVPKPPGLHAPQHRKRPHRPRLLREPSRRRQQVLELLLQGQSYAQIARSLNVGYATVHCHVKTLYKQRDVHDRAALAKSLARPAPGPRVSARRQAVRSLLDAGHSWLEIARELGTTVNAVHHHVKAIRRERKATQSPSDVTPLLLKSSARCHHERGLASAAHPDIREKPGPK